MRLAGKTIIITGASSGIGEAAAQLFAEEGANVVLGARRGDVLEDLAARIASQGGQVTALAGDVRDAAYAEELVGHAKEQFGGLDGAFNNAGMMGELAPVETMDEHEWHKVIDTNLTSAFLAAKYQIPALKHRGGGAIVYTSSFVGYSNAGLPGMAAYAASKAGMVGLTQSLAAQHGAEGIRVNAIQAGTTDTEIHARSGNPDRPAKVALRVPLGRVATAEDIAHSVVWLASDEASYASGAILKMGGGL